MKKALTAFSSFMKSLEANHPKGIRTRTRLAVICALTFIAIDTVFVICNYKYIPEITPEFYDTNGVLVEARHKSVFFEYEIERVFLLLGTVFAAWIIRPCFKTPIIYARVRCLLFDTVNLFITSIIAVCMVDLAITKGESYEISYFSEWMIFLFWTAILLVEFFFDLRKIRRNEEKAV